MQQLLESEFNSEQFLISSENLSFKEVIDLIADCMGSHKPTIYADKRMTNMAWKAEKLRTFFTGKVPVITRDSARISHKRYFYSNQKIREKLSYNFNPVKDIIEFTVGKYLAENNESF